MSKIRPGFTSVEMVIVLAVVMTLLRLAVPNVMEFTERAADTTAQKDFRRIKSILRESYSDSETTPLVLILNKDSRDPLPAPFSSTSLESGVRIHYAVQMSFPGYFDITALKVSHDNGKHYFQLLEINDKGVEQIVKKVSD